MRSDPTSSPDETFNVVHGFESSPTSASARACEVKRLLKPEGQGLFFEHISNSALVERLDPEGHYTSRKRPITWAKIQA